jgi:peptide/nickel transport system substrate-binding protein
MECSMTKFQSGRHGWRPPGRAAHRGWWLVLLMATIVTQACAAPSAPPAGAGQGANQPPAAGGATQAPKRLIVGILQEPQTWAPWVTTTTAGGANQAAFLIKRTLTTQSQDGQLQPDLAVSLPTLENGAWKVNADGTMEQTWKVKPNAKWHDGHAVTADDFVFGFEVESNKDLPRSVSPAYGLISSARATDATTLVLNMKSSTPLAGQMLYFPAPRHILGDILASDPDKFINHEYWTTAFVGTGPYRLSGWEPGAFQEFTAFADYVGGKPKIDTVILKFLTDSNTLLANVLSGGVEVALPDGLSIDMAVELRGSWAAPGTGNNVITYNDGRYFYMEFQHRPEWAKPSAARDPRVRRAFYHTVDKDGVNLVETAGLGILADSWIAPEDPRRAQFKDSIPEWSQDFNLANRILEEAGWRKGSDGVLVNSGTGERMDTEIRVTNGQGHVKAMAVLAEGWRKVGANVSEVAIPAARVSDQEYRSTFPFAGLSGYPMRYFEWESWRFACATGAQADTRWNGHRDGYCSQAADPFITRLQGVLQDKDRTPLQADIMRIILKEEYAGPPLYWQVSPLVYAKGIIGPVAPKLGQYDGVYSGAAINLWDKS